MRAYRHEPRRRCQRHRCRPRSFEDQRQFAEEVSGLESRNETVLLAHLRSTLDQDEERVCNGRFFVDQRVMRGEIHLLCKPRNLGQVTLRALGEERHMGE